MLALALNGWDLWGLFLSSFLSSTLLPGGSEAVLLALSLQAIYPSWLLLLAASMGNTLGGMTSWGIGQVLGRRFAAVERLPGKTQQAVQRIRRWGSPVLVFSWLPLLGDPLCVAAGWLRISWMLALLWIGIGKTLRYAFILVIAQ